MEGVSLKPYLIVPPDYFAYVPVTSRNGEKITIAHNNTNDTYICSSSYIVFNVTNPDVVCSDYLFMYYNRPEFDRYTRFNSWGSAREAFSWDEMCDIKVDLPQIEIQKKFAAAYTAILCNENYRLRLGNIAPILIKGSLEEAKTYDSQCNAK
jgi:type I restriction enzyme S subunit